jgi:phage terminase large subunit GpA-like protein
VRKHSKPEREVLALKGAPDAVGRVEIWTPPKKVDPNSRSTKASRAGVSVHIVGTAKAKDLILGWSENAGRVRLEGDGPGRMHWFEEVRDDFYEQLLSEIKIPSRKNPAKREWKPRTDRRNEALDCTVYAIYLYRHKRLHLRKPAMWDVVETRIRQAPLMLEEGQDGVWQAAQGADSLRSINPSSTTPEPIKVATPQPSITTNHHEPIRHTPRPVRAAAARSDDGWSFDRRA